jgi:tRNA(Ile2)-agmatinylcytidine synthase
MVLWIGVDDTDSLRGMCTTFVATEIVRELTEDYDLIGYPRLVRLNPNIPWKTRGNGAVCLCVGRGRGQARVVGSIGGHVVRAYPRAQPRSEPDDVLDRVGALVERWSDLAAEGTDPGLVVLRRKPDPGLYWRAVRSIVLKSEALEAVRGLGEWREWKTGRGVIGAAAACSWRPRDRTWEVLAYRDPARWGTPRWVDSASVRSMDRRYPDTFNNYDYESDRVVIAPRTPCPVLLGVRGNSPTSVVRAFQVLRCERPDRSLLFLTNQGTDDHVHPGPTDTSSTAGRFVGRVTAPTRTLPGGHTVFRLGSRDVTAYEPSKGFREIVRALAPGDTVEVVGSLRDGPRTINMEKFQVLKLAKVERKIANPLCDLCGLRMKSRGRGAPFRCRRCAKQVPRDRALTVPIERSLSLGWYQPPAGSRRHLAKPINRLRRSPACAEWPPMIRWRGVRGLMGSREES